MDKRANRPELHLRLKTAFFLGLLILGSLYLHPYAFLTVFAVIFYFIAIEFNYLKSRFLSLDGLYRIWVSSLSLLPFLISFYFLYIGEYPFYLPGLFLIFALMGSAISVLDMFSCGFAAMFRLPAWLVNIFYLGMHFAMLPLLFHYFPSVLWMLIILIVIWTTDTTAYFTGKMWGKRKLYPSLSAGKTQVGFLGGLIGAMVALALLYPYLGIGLPFALVTGLFAGLLVTTGDLVESRYKRLAGVKDSGNKLPGHGGYYDRFDALFFMLPYLVMFLLYLN